MHFPEKDKIFSQLDKIVLHPQKVVVGVSWWPDSTLAFQVMNDYFISKGWDPELIIVAHFHHGQRKESDNELKEIYRKYKYHHIYYNTDKPKKWQKETILRRLRKDFFQEVCKKEKAIYLITGHNLDDRIETSFMNLLRGTSLQGLSNMTFCDYREGLFYLRPLIALQKRYIQELCDVNHLSYFTDNSNKNSSLTIRNALRNDIFPQMTMLSTQNRRYESRSLIYSQIERKAPEMASDKVRILPKHCHVSRKAVDCYQIRLGSPNQSNSYTESDRVFVFHKLWIHKNISQKTLAERVRFSNTSTDGYKFLSGVYFFVAHGKIYAIRAKEKFREESNSASLIIKRGQKSALFDGTTFRVKPERIGWKIRYAIAGDAYKWKRLKKRMLNNKIPLFWRNYTPVIEKNGKIIDVVNLAEYYRY